jgi:hypothetical protein
VRKSAFDSKRTLLLPHNEAQSIIAFGPYRIVAAGRWQSAKKYSVVGGDFTDIANRNWDRLDCVHRIFRHGDSRHPQKLIKSGWRKHKEIVIFDVARIAQLVRNVARGHEAITCSEDEDLSADGDFQLSGEDIVRLVLTRMHMPRHILPTRERRFEEAVCSSGICARQTQPTATSNRKRLDLFWYLIEGAL